MPELAGPYLGLQDKNWGGFIRQPWGGGGEKAGDPVASQSCGEMTELDHELTGATAWVWLLGLEGVQWTWSGCGHSSEGERPPE